MTKDGALLNVDPQGRMADRRSQTTPGRNRRRLDLATRRYFFASPTSIRWPSGSRM
jgi:hypothetical protein